MTARQAKYIAPKLGKVLIAEDEALIGKSVQKELQALEVEADWYSDFKTSSAALKTEDYHAVVVDVFLSPPIADGLELIKLAKDAGVPSVIITSALDLNVAKAGLNNGADHLLEKPFKIGDLMKMLMDIWENPKGLIARRERFLELHQLTPKEKELCRLVLKGLTNAEISEVSGNTMGTVKFYSSQIFEKFEVKNRSELFNLIFPT
ncbi:MAG: hypothetical protein COV44_03610 [Deltaproteobacteria bacterium CG11_big_fil_rev_8_21_14_0_20_45_16]|nr:MAG: hypothetical protein COV44_03610 [Deltaproteobacteria bacterium CG11_big_fil_rev_8_21_14_0_20_45_16]